MLTRLVKYSVDTPVGSFDRLGVVLGEKYVDLNLAYTKYLADVAREQVPYALASVRAPSDLLAFIEGGQKSIDAAKEVAQYMKDKVGSGVKGPKGEKIVYDPKEVKLLPALPSLKTRMFAMGRNFRGHVAAEMVPKRPAGFLKNTYSCVADGENVVFPKLITTVLNIEVELVAYICKQGKNLKKENAMDYVMGYTIGNDISAREQQRLDVEDRRYVYPGKNADTLAPLGSFITLKDEIPDPYVLKMSSRVNGKAYQEAVVEQMIFKYDEILEYFSRDYTIYPGDMLWGGSVAYVDKTLGPLKQGDKVECEIEKVGLLRNTVV